MDVEAHLFNTLARLQSDGSFNTLWVAFSGGLDSTVLLHSAVCVTLRLDVRLIAVHVDHGLSPHSTEWAEHCADVCRTLGVELRSKRVSIVPQPGESLEQLARAARYEVFATLLGPGDAVLTAHHQRDQAETVLLQLCRGAGPRGLAAMPESMEFGTGKLIRPLLTLPVEALIQYASERQLHWIKDPSNESVEFTRNFLRHEILPRLSHRWPTIDRSLSRTSHHCAEAMEIMESMARQDLGIGGDSSLSDVIPLSPLKDLSFARRKNALRYWIHRLGVRLPSSAKLTDIDTQLFSSNLDRRILIQWAGVEIRRYRSSAYLLRHSSAQLPAEAVVWRIRETPQLDLPIGQLQARRAASRGISIEKIAAHGAVVSVRFRRGGERCQYRPGHHKTLKKVFQELGVPPWQRDSTPLIFIDDELVAIPGLCVFQPYLASRNEQGFEISFDR